MKYELSSQVINNILVFLDKVEYKGLKEVSAINEVISALNKPIKEDINEQESNESGEN